MSAKNGAVHTPKLYATGPVTFSNKNGKMKQQDHGWANLKSRKDYGKHEIFRSKVSIQTQLNTFDFTRPRKEQRRYDQFVKPHYPQFEKVSKEKRVGSFHHGWGTTNRSLKYNHPNQQMGQLIDREHLKFFDKVKPSKYAGYPAGFNEKSSDKQLLDLDPENYKCVYPFYPNNTHLSVRSLDMQRQSNFYQQTQGYLQQRAQRERSFGKTGRPMGIVAQ